MVGVRIQPTRVHESVNRKSDAIERQRKRGDDQHDKRIDRSRRIADEATGDDSYGASGDRRTSLHSRRTPR